MKNIFVINGSASDNSSNQKLIDVFADLTKDFFRLTVFNDLKTLPHFDPELSINNTPKAILDFETT
jgi:NAD(P)H-dependent FMN reductase